VLDIGCEGVKILRGLVHHAQDAFDGPICSGLRGQRSKPACGAAQTHQSEKRKGRRLKRGLNPVKMQRLI